MYCIPRKTFDIVTIISTGLQRRATGRSAVAVVGRAVRSLALARGEDAERKAAEELHLHGVHFDRPRASKRGDWITATTRR